VSKKLKALSFAVLITAAVLFLDQWTKHIVVDYFNNSLPPKELYLTSWFNICLVYNRGISFGLLQNMQIDGSLILAFLAITAAIALLVWVVCNPQSAISVSAGLIAGGAVGNAIDRLSIGAVVDFIDWHILEYHWPAFNFADSSICVGAAVAFLYTLIHNKCHSKITL
jgi:signal peptidase II